METDYEIEPETNLAQEDDPEEEDTKNVDDFENLPEHQSQESINEHYKQVGSRTNLQRSHNPTGNGKSN